MSGKPHTLEGAGICILLKDNVRRKGYGCDAEGGGSKKIQLWVSVWKDECRK
jgi:hypothetical protein